jgi:RNA polymerase sigma-70 factor, ECF subfamily
MVNGRRPAPCGTEGACLVAVASQPVGIRAPGTLLRRAREGDRLAFAELYLEFFDPIYRHLLRAMGNREDAQDAAQDVFVKAMGAISRFEDRGPPLRAWLFQIARNHAIDHARKHGRVRVTDPGDLAEHQDAFAAQAAENVAHLGHGGGVAALIADLPRTQQRVLALRYISDMTPTEIGDAIGTSADSVRHMHHRALRSLADQLPA